MSSMLVLFGLISGIWAWDSGAQSLTPMLTVEEGYFEMGRPYSGTAIGEQPVHTVWLDRYQIGMYPETAAQFTAFLNSNLSILEDNKGNPYTGGIVHAYGQPIACDQKDSDNVQIFWDENKFAIRSWGGYGGQLFPMDEHPVIRVSWYGAVCYCNWLSQREGLEPYYDVSTWKRYHPVRNGYRLPTEAEWERAAAWDGEKHWHYGMMSDTLDITLANYEAYPSPNPLGLEIKPYTTPVGWYNGINPVTLSTPEILTRDARSPVGAYDMSGGVWEWCHDWYSSTYYNSSPGRNPSGPAKGYYKAARGGHWQRIGYDARCAARNTDITEPWQRYYFLGFRIAKSDVELTHPSDRNHDGQIDHEEAMGSIDGWQSGDLSMAEAIRMLYISERGGAYFYNPELEPPLHWELAESEE
jgi:formylglycine-generating enzyme required for sulfatase activity